LRPLSFSSIGNRFFVPSAGKRSSARGGVLAYDAYTRFDLNNPVEWDLFKKLGEVVSDTRSKQREWGPHCWNVARLTTRLALKLGRPVEQAIDYGVAAYLHDWGKQDPEIAPLFRLERKFTPEERAEADKHGYLGAMLARKLYKEKYDQRKLRLIITGQLTHHIHFEGGWLNSLAASLLFGENEPRFLAGKKIPRIGRIIHVVDSFDTIIQKRPYKDAHSVEYACREIRNASGKFYDPDMVEALMLVLPEMLPQDSRRIISSQMSDVLVT
jgi:HD-GYP domain-containing protein (c-di-GMP phosphodiesterase class II)